VISPGLRFRVPAPSGALGIVSADEGARGVCVLPFYDEHTRSELILSALGANGRVQVNELAQRLAVSPVTIRKDLDALEQRAALRRVRGGAVAAPVLDEGSFETRLQTRRAEKRAIARAAAPLVEDGEVIALDSSSTCHYLAQQLLDRRSLVVITNGLPTAMLFSERSEATVLVPGGVVRRSARSVVGVFGDVLAGRGRIDKLFIGAHAVSAERGLLEMGLEEAQAKQYLAAHCRQLYGLADSTKFGSFSLHSAVGTADITALYTDSGADPALVARVEANGPPVHRVEVREEDR
jgi:DeoR/GlpR family transcriptional regulator of sugar metabolism